MAKLSCLCSGFLHLGSVLVLNTRTSTVNRRVIKGKPFLGVLASDQLQINTMEEPYENMSYYFMLYV